MTIGSHKCNAMDPDNPKVKQLVRDALAVQQQGAAHAESRARYHRELCTMRPDVSLCVRRRDGEMPIDTQRRVDAFFPPVEEVPEDAEATGDAVQP